MSRQQQPSTCFPIVACGITGGTRQIRPVFESDDKVVTTAYRRSGGISVAQLDAFLKETNHTDCHDLLFRRDTHPSAGL
jgi:hypothetical protein